jgi:hypothetical protein
MTPPDRLRRSRASKATARAVLGAGIHGVIGGIRETANGIRDGWQQGSQSVAGRLGEAWYRGVVGGIRGTLNGIRDGRSGGSQSPRPPH